MNKKPKNYVHLVQASKFRIRTPELYNNHLLDCRTNMLRVYLFLYIFSINVPIFYHGAILAGFLSFVQYVNRYGDAPKINRYSILVIINYAIVFLYLMLFNIINGFEDLTYFKTFINSFVTIMCGIPIINLYVRSIKRDLVEKLINDLACVFLFQTIIAVFFTLNPNLDFLPKYFHRQAELAEEAGNFSGGIRTNFISGPLFFGLSTMYGIIVLLLTWANYLYNHNANKIWFFFVFIFLNLGIFLAGRAGYIYLICLFAVFLYRPLDPRRLLLIISPILLFFLVYFALYLLRESSDLTRLIYDYAFEFIVAYLNSGSVSTYSTAHLFEMYEINISIEDLVLGHGLYTNPDDTYYMHTDVGYLRKLLYGGMPLMILSVIFTICLVYPFFNSKKYRARELNALGFAIFLAFVLLEFKGEAMLTLVSLNSLVFLIASLLYLSGGDSDKRSIN